MPSKRAALEKLKYEVNELGEGDDPCHIVDIKKEQAKRNTNDGPQPKTKFGFETDSPEAYRELNKCKDFVIKTVGNKSVAITLLIWAWRQLDESTIHKLLAAGEVPNAGL
jgi:hypothetical protein